MIGFNASGILGAAFQRTISLVKAMFFDGFALTLLQATRQLIHKDPTNESTSLILLHAFFAGASARLVYECLPPSFKPYTPFYSEPTPQAPNHDINISFNTRAVRR